MPEAFGDVRAGKHRPEGVFMAYGQDFKENRLGTSIYTWDIAPTALHLLGFPIPDYMDGRVLKEVFKEGSSPDYWLVIYTCPTERKKISLHLKGLKRSCTR